MWGAASGAALQPGAELHARVVALQHPHEFTARLVRPGSWLRAPGAPPRAGAGVRYGLHGLEARVERVAGAACDVRLAQEAGGGRVRGVRWAGEQLLPARWDEPQPPVELRCRLYRAEPLDAERGWSARSVAAFARLVGAGAHRLTVRRVAPDGLLDVDLDGYQHPENVTMMMVLTGTALWGLENNQADPSCQLELCALQHYTYDRLPLAATTEATLVHFSGSSFHLIKRERYSTCRDMNGKVRNNFEDCECVSERDIVEDLPVLCKTKHKTHDKLRYLRGIVIHVSDSKKKALVYFVDRGGEEIVSVSGDILRHPTQQLLEEPALAVHCNFNTEQENDHRIHARMTAGANLRLIT